MTYRLARLLGVLLLAGAAHAQTSPVYDAAVEAGATPKVAASLAAAVAATTEDALLRASNAGAGDDFGVSVSLDGDRALIGASLEDGPADGVYDAGAAYVFERSGGVWSETAVLRASNAGVAYVFGVSVSLDGDRALVGAFREDGPADGMAGAGAAYVFELAGGAWSETAVLRASNAGAYDGFGLRVSLGGDRALVGAFLEDGPADGVNDAGAAYVFELAGGAWSETAVLRASNAGAGDGFGLQVSLDGDRALVGAFLEDGPADGETDAGAAYVFDLAGGAWSETAVLRASNAGANDRLGFSVSLDGDRALIGARTEDGPADGVTDAGAAYVFDLSGGAWSETAVLRASNAGAGDDFAAYVSLSGDRALIGAWAEDGPADGMSGVGAAYVFELAGGAWSETTVLRTSNAGAGDRLGWYVSLDGDRALVGASLEDGPADGETDAGAAYVFELPTTTVAAEDGLRGGAVSLVRPNPAGTRADLVVSPVEAGVLRAVVYDALGREVAVVHDGPVSGTVRLDLGAGGLAPGTYVVRVTGAGVWASRPFTVVR